MEDKNIRLQTVSLSCASSMASLNSSKDCGVIEKKINDLLQPVTYS